MIHAEVMTHRVFSRNAASSRAIPFEKMLKMVQEDPFVPIAWQKDHTGMQGVEYFEEQWQIDYLKGQWLEAKDNAVKVASHLSDGITKLVAMPGMRGFEPTLLPDTGLTKQLCNRLLEPFMWYTCLVTTTEYDNFFELRCPKYQTPVSQTIEYQRSWKDLVANHSNPINLDLMEKMSLTDKLLLSKSAAEIHIQALAESMWDARNESEPRLLKAGEWHIPFGDQMDLTINSPVVKEAARKIIEPELLPEFDSLPSFSIPTIDYSRLINEIKIKVAIARCARLSYMTFEGEINYQKDIDLFDILFKNKHMSPFEHVARCMSDNEYSQFSKFYPASLSRLRLHPSLKRVEDGVCNNIKGFIQYRFFLEHENNAM
jgi:hypothetical protein